MCEPAVVTDAAAELPADYAALHEEALKRCRGMVMLPAHAWKQRSVVDGATIALHTPPGSPHVMMRSEVHINMAPERCFAFYLSEKNMRRWAPDAKLREVVRVSPAASVQHASYPLPAPLDARDAVVYRASLAGAATGLPGCVRATLALSIDHDLVGPPAAGTVRVELFISTVCFMAVPGHATCARVVSFQHVDLRGRLPPALITRGVGAGTASLRAVRDDLNALAAMEARAMAKQAADARKKPQSAK